MTRDEFQVRVWRDSWSKGWGYEAAIMGAVIEFGWAVSKAAANDEAERAIARYTRQYAERPQP